MVYKAYVKERGYDIQESFPSETGGRNNDAYADWKEIEKELHRYLSENLGDGTLEVYVDDSPSLDEPISDQENILQIYYGGKKQFFTLIQNINENEVESITVEPWNENSKYTAKTIEELGDIVIGVL